MRALGLLLGLLLCGPFIFAQQPNALAQMVATRQAAGEKFPAYSLLIPCGGLDPSLQRFVADGLLFSLDEAAVSGLYQAAPTSISLEWPVSADQSITLQLVQSPALTDDFQVRISSRSGEAFPVQPGRYYRGIVAGEPRSVAAVSIFEGELMAVVARPGVGNLVLGRLPDDLQGRYILYRERDLLETPDFECDALELPPGVKKLPSIEGSSEQKVVDNCVRAYLECEYDFFLEKGSVQGVINHMTGLFNIVSALYQNESIDVDISEIFVWDTPDAFATSSTSSALNSFQNIRTSYNGDIAHLVSRGAPTGGGVAWVDVLCTNFGYAYSYIGSNYNPLPTYSWSANVLTHEMGHNLGSRHTHDCSWTVNGQPNQAIDGCGPQVGIDGNGSCGQGPIPAAGTIMSYCHLISSVGIDLSLGFGPQPGDLIRSKVNSAGCLSPCGGGGCNFDVAINRTHVDCFGNATGAATASPVGGTAPFSYAWSTGASTPGINGLAAGNYAVTLTDSEGCTATKNAAINQPSPLLLQTSAVDASCAGGSDGIARALGNGGTPPYSYQWSNGSTLADNAGVPAGNYQVTIVDAAGCTASGSTTVQAAPGISLQFGVTDESVAGAADGAIQLGVSGGTPPYTFEWSNDASSKNINNLQAGTYVVTVTDSNGCSATGSATVEATTVTCLPLVELPYEESFETGLGDWLQLANDHFDWTRNTGSTPTSGTGPEAASHGSYYLFAEADGHEGKKAVLEGPCFDLSTASTPMLAFDYHLYGSEMGSLTFQVSTTAGASWTGLYQIAGHQGNSWQTALVDLSDYAGQIVKLRFIATIDGQRSDLAIDHLRLGEDLSTGLTDLSRSSLLTLWPNPAQDRLQVRLETSVAESLQWQLVDCLGRAHAQGELQPFAGLAELELAVDRLPNGFYLLVLQGDSGPPLSKRFVVQR